MNMELQHIIGQNLRRFRAAQGMTREAVAEKVGISVTFYANLESGNRMMSVPILKKIAGVLCVSTDSLLFEEQDNTHIEDITLLLKSQPHSTLALCEKVVRLLVNEMQAREQKQEVCV